jgi:hypothetical protein
MSFWAEVYKVRNFTTPEPLWTVRVEAYGFHALTLVVFSSVKQDLTAAFPVNNQRVVHFEPGSDVLLASFGIKRFGSV